MSTQERLPTHEPQFTNVNCFSPYTKELLKARSFPIVSLAPLTIAQLRKFGISFETDWHEGEKLEQVPARAMEVSYDPWSIPLDGTFRATFENLIKITKKLSKESSYEIPGTKCLLGSIAEYAQIVFNRDSLLDLFDHNFLASSTLIYTPVRTRRFIGIGKGDSDSTFAIFDWDTRSKSDSVNILPLIVPAQSVQRAA